MRKLLACAMVVASVSSSPSRVHAEDNEFWPPPPGVPMVSSTAAGTSGETDTVFSTGLANDGAPRVAAILAAHPDRDVLICLAGCGGGPKLVAIRNRPPIAITDAANAGQLLPAAARMPDAGAASAAPATAYEASVGDVICLAGCVGSPGEVVQKAIRLTWVGQNANDELKTALRAIGDRLLAGEAFATPDASTGREWVSDQARAHLVAPHLPHVLAELVRSASPLVDRRAVVTKH